MPGTFKVDQAATFEAVVLMGCEPKIVFGSESGEQETTREGTPKWELRVATASRDGFGRTANEMLKVGIAADKYPAESIMPGTPVELVDFEVGVMDKTRRDKDTGKEHLAGAQVWYRAQGVKPATANGRKTAASQSSGGEG